jgi:Uma2 family endonuclease
MSVAPADYLAAIEHLPAGAVLRFDDVSWEDYENLLADLGDGYAVRIFYDNGRMEVMAPASTMKTKKRHQSSDHCSGDELDIDVESLGSTTLKRRLRPKAQSRMTVLRSKRCPSLAKTTSTLRTTAADIVVEVDRTSSSLNKFDIYAALDVPEIWRVTGRRVDFYRLTESGYQNTPASRAFPFLPARILSDFLQRVLTEGGRKAAREFRDWVRERHTTQ